MKPDQQRTAMVEHLATAHGADLLKLGIALTGRRDDAEDLVQLTLERLLLRRGSLDDPLPYARRVLANAAKDGWRRQKVRHEKDAVSGGLVADHADQVAAADHVLGALAGLPAGQRRVVLLRYWLDLTEAQTAETLGIRVGTVKSQCARALSTLRGTVGTPTVVDR